MRTELLRRSIILTLVVAAISCGREPTRFTLRPSEPGVELVPPALASFSAGVSTDPNDGSGGADLPAFNDFALVDITVTGLITQYNIVTGVDLQYGPRGLPSCLSGGYTITYGGVLALAPFPCNAQNFADPMATGRTVVKGSGHAGRSAGPSCPGCFTYSGSQTVSVTEIPVSVSVVANYSQAPLNTPITFTATLNPVSIDFRGWWFFGDNGFTHPICQQTGRNPCVFAPAIPGQIVIFAGFGSLER